MAPVMAELQKSAGAPPMIDKSTPPARRQRPLLEIRAHYPRYSSLSPA
jgi:hypothetical protein